MEKKTLEAKTVKELRVLAQKQGITGVSRMIKSELVSAIGKAAAKTSKKKPSPKAKPKTALRSTTKKTAARARRKVSSAAAEKPAGKGSSSPRMRGDRPHPEPSFELPQPLEIPPLTETLAPEEPIPVTPEISSRTPEPEPITKSRIGLLIQDPYWLHAYWEIAPISLEEARRALGKEWDNSRRVLRIYHLGNSDGNGEKRHQDQELYDYLQNWYFPSEPNIAYQVEIGYLSPSGRFYAIAQSKKLVTPRAGMSEKVDPQWHTLRSEKDYEQIYALSGGFRVSSSSLELRQQLHQFLQEQVSSGSGAISSFGSGMGWEYERQRGFWFKLDCELIVYGATEPDATVTVQGKPVQLRPDGTFTLRFALPDGKQVIDATAASADGVEERTITPTVTRSTEVLEPVIKK